MGLRSLYCFEVQSFNILQGWYLSRSSAREKGERGQERRRSRFLRLRLKGLIFTSGAVLFVHGGFVSRV